IPCLLTEITIAGGFLALMANDMVMIQQFGIVTAAGMLLTWLANVTVLPLAIHFLGPAGIAPVREGEVTGGAAGQLRRAVAWIEHVILHRPRAIVVVTAALCVVAAGLTTRIGKEYYSY